MGEVGGGMPRWTAMRWRQRRAGQLKPPSGVSPPAHEGGHHLHVFPTPNPDINSSEGAFLSLALARAAHEGRSPTAATQD